jgi:hypothetical protein
LKIRDDEVGEIVGRGGNASVYATPRARSSRSIVSLSTTSRRSSPERPGERTPDQSDEMRAVRART